MMESVVADVWTSFLEALKVRRIAVVCAAAVAVMSIGVFHAPAGPALLGCGGAVVILVGRDCLRRAMKKQSF